MNSDVPDNQGDLKQTPLPISQASADEESMFSSGTREYYAAEVRTGANKAFIFGLLSIFCCPPIFAFYAYSTANEALSNMELYEVEAGKKSLAQAGKVLAICGAILWVIGIIVRIVGT